MTGYADFAAAFRRLLNLFAARAFEITVVLSVPIEKSSERIIHISLVPGELGKHLGIVSGKDSVDCENHEGIAYECRHVPRNEYVCYDEYHAVGHKIPAELVHTMSACHELCNFISEFSHYSAPFPICVPSFNNGNAMYTQL